MNFQVNINICRVCIKTEQGVSLLEDPELRTKFMFTTRLQLNENDNMPSLICAKCVTRLKIAHDFVQLAHDSDKNLKAFLTKISKDFQQVTKSSLEEEDDELMTLVQESEEQAKIQAPQKDETNVTTTKLGVPQEQQMPQRRKTNVAKKSPTGKVPAAERSKYAAAAEVVQVIVKEEEEEQEAEPMEVRNKTDAETELSMEMETAGEEDESYIKFTYKYDNIQQLKETLDGTDEQCTDEESQTELEMLDESLQQCEDIQSTGEQAEQTQQQQQCEDGLQKGYEALLEEGDEFLEDAENEKTFDERSLERTNLYENTESLLPEEEDYTITEVLDQVDTLGGDEVEHIKEECNSDSQNEATPPIFFNAVKAKPKSRRTQSARTGVSSTGGSKPSRRSANVSLNTRFFCFECNRDFSTKTNLTRHMTTHDGNRPFQCNICGRGFTQNASLKQHMYTHTGEKPYVCEVCNRGFTQSKCLVFHMRRHTGEKPFKCQCGIQFRQKDGLKIHILRHHTLVKSDGDSEIHTCFICKKILEDRYSLQIHMKQHVNNHAITDDPTSTSITQNSDDILMELVDEEELLSERPALISDTLPLNVDDITSSTHVVDVMATSASEPARAKKFQCRKCFKCFAIKKSLIRHLAIHDVPATEQLLCRICNITFDTSNAFKAHQQSEHKSRNNEDKLVILEGEVALNDHMNLEQQFVCAECPNLHFNSQKLLIKHTLTEHELNEVE